MYKALSDETYSVAEDLAKYFIEIEEKIKSLSLYQEVIRSEIQNGTHLHPIKKTLMETHLERDEKDQNYPLALIQENADEDHENFSFEHIDEDKKEIKSPDRKSPVLFKVVKKSVNFEKNSSNKLITLKK